MFSFFLLPEIVLTIEPWSTVVEEGKSFMFVCTVENYPHMDDWVDFIKKFTVLASLYQKENQCHIHNKTASVHYQVNCSEGTNEAISDVKRYTLQIYQISTKDQGIWLCQLILNRIWSKTYYLKVRSK